MMQCGCSYVARCISYLVSDKAISSCLRLEVPNHEARVHGARDQLLHVGIERHTGYSVSVSLEMPLKAGIILEEHKF